MKSFLVFQPDHIIDIITNSSSELFVLNGNNKKEVIKMIKKVYKNYRDEYQEVVSTRELTWRNLSEYLYFSYHCWDEKLGDYTYKIIPGLTKKEMIITTRTQFSDGRIYAREELNGNMATGELREKLNKAIDPNNNMFFMFSLGDNPDFDKQEALENIGAKRYHLG